MKLDLKLDTNLLKQLYLIEHPSQAEYKMISFIIQQCYKISNIEISLDHYSNIFIVKNSTNPDVYPCLVAHMDESQKYQEDKQLMVKGDFIYGRYKNTLKQCGLGADDSNGICIALQLLQTLPNLKICFTTEEEIGGKGAIQAALNIEFFNNVQYLIQADRRGKSDLITNSNGIEITSDAFLRDITPLCDRYNYVSTWGTFTDVGVLAEELLISSINVSCGYYLEHTWKEHTNVKELENCLNFIYDIILTLDNTIYTINAAQFYNQYYDERYCKDYEKWAFSQEITHNWDYYNLTTKCSTCTTGECMSCRDHEYDYKNRTTKDFY